MVVDYKKFLEINRSSDKTNAVYVSSMKFKNGTCICINRAQEKYTLPITILILDAYNGMCHINDASKLRKWAGWGTDIDYPSDYFNDPAKYVKALKPV